MTVGRYIRKVYVDMTDRHFLQIFGRNGLFGFFDFRLMERRMFLEQIAQIRLGPRRFTRTGRR